MLKVDKDLLDQCKKGDRRAQNELYEKCYAILLSICLRYERNLEEAKHIMNLGFLKIATNLDRWSPEVSFENWIRRIMINTNIDEYRKKKKRRQVFSDLDVEDHKPDLRHFDVNAALDRLNVEVLEKLVQNLPEDMRKVFNLFAIDGYSHGEIGEMLDIPEGTSKWLLSIARKSLREKIISLTAEEHKIKTL